MLAKKKNKEERERQDNFTPGGTKENSVDSLKKESDGEPSSSDGEDYIQVFFK